MDLKNNTILITGGSKGIGLELVKNLIDDNEIIICGRSIEALNEAKKLYPKVHVIPCDLGLKSERVKLVIHLNNHFKNLNVIINNAGIQKDIDFLHPDLDSHEFDELKINLEAPIHLIQLLLPLIRENKNPTIINVSSGLAFMTLARAPLYCATKAGIHSFTKSLRHQLKGVVEVIEIIPPAVDTNLNQEAREKLNFKVDLKTPEYVAEVIECLKNGDPEIGFGDSLEKFNSSSKKDLEKIFNFMNK